MNRWTRVGIVLAGYVLSMVASVVVVAIYDRRFSAADNQTMGGMIAGGEMMLGAGVFVFFALFPTAFALWSLRRHRGAWSVFAAMCLGFAAVGMAAVLTTFARSAPSALFLQLAALLGIMQMLSAPIWVVGFGLFALLAPARALRRTLLVAAALEVAIAACGLVHFVVVPAL